CFFFSSRRRHTRLVSDWSSDVCSSDLSSLPVRTSTSGTVPSPPGRASCLPSGEKANVVAGLAATAEAPSSSARVSSLVPLPVLRSEERRVGKERRSRGRGGRLEKKQDG